MMKAKIGHSTEKGGEFCANCSPSQLNSLINTNRVLIWFQREMDKKNIISMKRLHDVLWWQQYNLPNRKGAGSS